MYKELVALLRKKYDKAPLVMEAADAIEELFRQNARWEEVVLALLDYLQVWVSVADGLPEDMVDVVCWLHDDAGDCYACVGHYVTRFKMWDLDSEYSLSRHVTHWMPIPEPPIAEIYY